MSEARDRAVKVFWALFGPEGYDTTCRGIDAILDAAVERVREEKKDDARYLPAFPHKNLTREECEDLIQRCKAAETTYRERMVLLAALIEQRDAYRAAVKAILKYQSKATVEGEECWVVSVDDIRDELAKRGIKIEKAG